jgi:hypothetical protein
MKDNFNCPYCKQPILITTGDEIREATKRHDEAALNQQRWDAIIETAIKSTPHVEMVVGWTPEIEFEGTRTEAHLTADGRPFKRLCVPADLDNWNVVHTTDNLFRDINDFPAVFGVMVDQFRAAFIRECLRDDQFSPLPHAYGGSLTYIPLRINRRPVRFLMSYNHLRGAWMMTLDACYVDDPADEFSSVMVNGKMEVRGTVEAVPVSDPFAKSWRELPSQL